MPKFQLTLVRETVEYCTVVVEADSQTDAIDTALIHAEDPKMKWESALGCPNCPYVPKGSKVKEVDLPADLKSEAKLSPVGPE